MIPGTRDLKNNALYAVQPGLIGILICYLSQSRSQQRNAIPKVVFTAEMNSRIKYYFDTESSQYKRVRVSTGDIVVNFSGILFLTLGIAGIMTLFYNTYFESPYELRLSNQVKEMEFYFGELNKKVELLSGALSSVEHRDDHIYRAVLGSTPIDPAIRIGGIDGNDRYVELRQKKLPVGEMIIELNEKVDRLRRNLYIESLSQDELAQI